MQRKFNASTIWHYFIGWRCHCFFNDQLEACVFIHNLQAAFKEEVEPAPAPTPAAAPVLAVGAVVILQGLKSAPELNDQKGEIDTWSLQDE